MQFQIIMFAFSLIGTAIALPVAPVDALNSKTNLRCMSKSLTLLLPGEDFAVSDFDSSVETNLGRSVPVDALNGMWLSRSTDERLVLLLLDKDFAVSDFDSSVETNLSRAV